MAVGDPRLHGLHFLAGFMTTLLATLWLSLIMFHFIYTGTTIKNAVLKKTVDKEEYYKTKGYKKALFPWILIAMVLLMASPFLGAAADTDMAPLWYHHAVAWEALLLVVLVVYLAKDRLKENRRIFVLAVESTFMTDPGEVEEKT